MQSLPDPSKIQSQLHQYQLMKRAAQVTAAQQLMSKANQQQQDNYSHNKSHQLNSPASSTSSSTTTDSSTTTHQQQAFSHGMEDLLSLEENIRGSQRQQREDLFKTIAAAAAVSNCGNINKRPFLKFSMDAILGTANADADNKSTKRLCHGFSHSNESEAAAGSSSPKHIGSDEAPYSNNKTHRIQLNYGGFNNAGSGMACNTSSSRSSSSSSSQRPSPTTSNGNNELMNSAESKIMSSQQQQQLAMAAAVVANSGKSGQVQFPLSMGKFQAFLFFFFLLS